MNTFPLQPLCDLIVEAVFPICAIFLLQYGHIRHNAATLSALISDDVHREADIRWGLIAGSMAEGLTMTPHWGHPWPDMDWMPLFGAQLKVNIPRDQLPREIQLSQNSSPVWISKGCDGNSWLEYDPEGCPPGYTKLRVLDIKALMEWNPEWDINADLSDCILEEGGQSWLNTARLNQVIMRAYNEGEDDLTQRTTSISGPAGQVIQRIKKKTLLKTHLLVKL